MRARTNRWVGWLPMLVALTIPLTAGARPRVEPYRPAETGTFEGGTDGEPSVEPWWVSFDDGSLDAVMDQGLAGNGDLGAAWERVDQARATAFGALAPQLPSLSVDVNANVAPIDSLGFQFGGLPTAPGEEEDDEKVAYLNGSALLNAWIPLDFWGPQVQAYRAGRYEAEATAGDRDARAISLSVTVGGAYFDAVAAGAQVALIESQIAAQESLLELTELRYRETDTSGLDVLQQRQQLEATRALLPTARSLERTSRQRLAALLGLEGEGALPALPAELAPLPAPPATGRPADLLSSRPDLRAADARWAAATARRHGAGLAFAPSLALTAQAGTQAIYFDELDTQPLWGVGAALSIPIFQGAGRFAGLAETRAAEDGAARTLSQRVREAVQQVESARVTEEELDERLAALERQLEAAVAVAEESRARYAAGLTPYLTVLTAVNARQQAELTLLQARRERIDARIRLHEALGGRWTANLADGR